MQILISTFVVHCLDSIIPLVSISEISSLYLASVAVRFESTLVANPEDRFSRDKAHFVVSRLRDMVAEEEEWLNNAPEPGQYHLHIYIMLNRITI